jgi:hypothetical protein
MMYPYPDPGMDPYMYPPAWEVDPEEEIKMMEQELEMMERERDALSSDIDALREEINKRKEGGE